jgi:hypothetical protein
MWRCCTPAVNNKHSWATQARACRPSFLRGPRARRQVRHRRVYLSPTTSAPPVLAMARFVSWAVRDGPVSSPFWPWRVLCPGPGATAPSHPRFPSLTDRVAMLPVSCRRWWWPWPCFASVVRGSLDVFTSTARHGPYLLVRLRVRPERHRAQSCVIALRSPAPERSSEYFRYSPDIHPKPVHQTQQRRRRLWAAASVLGRDPAS